MRRVRMSAVAIEHCPLGTAHCASARPSGGQCSSAETITTEAVATASRGGGRGAFGKPLKGDEEAEVSLG
jgi:hypothetical protein